MSELINSLIKERDELNKKIEKLKNFLIDGVLPKDHAVQKIYMNAQLRNMEQYSAMLTLRINDLKRDAPKKKQ